METLTVEQFRRARGEPAKHVAGPRKQTQPVPGKMNKTEQLYAYELDLLQRAGQIKLWKFGTVRLDPHTGRKPKYRGQIGEIQDFTPPMWTANHFAGATASSTVIPGAAEPSFAGIAVAGVAGIAVVVILVRRASWPISDATMMSPPINMKPRPGPPPAMIILANFRSASALTRPFLTPTM